VAGCWFITVIQPSEIWSAPADDNDTEHDDCQQGKDLYHCHAEFDLSHPPDIEKIKKNRKDEENKDPYRIWNMRKPIEHVDTECDSLVCKGHAV